MLVVESAIDTMKSLQGARAVHGQEPAVEGFSPTDNNTFFALLMATFGSIEAPRGITTLQGDLSL